jgi:hypothetical protein
VHFVAAKQARRAKTTLDSAEVAEEAAVERKEVRRVRLLLSELQVPEWQELAKDHRLKERKVLKSTRISSCKVRKNGFFENRRRGKTSYFLRKQRKARRVFCVILFYILGI